MIRGRSPGKGLLDPIHLPADEKAILRERESLRIRGVPWVLLAAWSVFLGVAWLLLRSDDIPGRDWLLAFVDGALIVLLVFMLPIWLYTVLRWWYNILVITERRVIHRRGILNERRRTLRLDNVVTVSVTRIGLAKLLGVGDVQVKTAGPAGEILMKGVWKPDRIRQLILDTQERLRLRQGKLGMEDISGQLQTALRLPKEQLDREDISHQLEAELHL
jgi:membrane protein YdbS with pleckstrin-like domain